MGRGHRTGKRRFRWFYLLMTGIVVYFAFLLISQQVYLSQVRQDQASAEARLAVARQENEALRQEKERLGDLNYIEKLAREELGMTRRGELPYSTGRK